MDGVADKHVERVELLEYLIKNFKKKLKELEDEYYNILNFHCVKCGENITDDIDWDYHDGGGKYEFYKCSNCGHKEITYEG